MKAWRTNSLHVRLAHSCSQCGIQNNASKRYKALHVCSGTVQGAFKGQTILVTTPNAQLCSTSGLMYHGQPHFRRAPRILGSFGPTSQKLCAEQLLHPLEASFASRPYTKPPDRSLLARTALTGLKDMLRPHRATADVQQWLAMAVLSF